MAQPGTGREAASGNTSDFIAAVVSEIHSLIGLHGKTDICGFPGIDCGWGECERAGMLLRRLRLCGSIVSHIGASYRVYCRRVEGRLLLRGRLLCGAGAAQQQNDCSHGSHQEYFCIHQNHPPNPVICPNYVLIMRLPAGRFLTIPFPPLPFAARFLAAVMRPPLLFFAIYSDDSGKRNFESVPLNIVIERQKQGLSIVPEENDKGNKLLFYLTPNDLVYVPTVEEKGNPGFDGQFSDLYAVTPRVYKLVSSTGSQAMFIKAEVASVILNKAEFSPLNKMEKSVDGIMIKDCCWKLKTDRLGNIIGLIGRNP